MRRFYQVFQALIYSIAAYSFAIVVLLSLGFTNEGFEKDPFHSTLFFIMQLPFYGLVLFGCYGMISIGYHVATLGKTRCDEM